MPRPANPRPYKKTVTRYELPGGSRCRSTGPGAQKRTTKTQTYYANVPGLGTISLETDNEQQAWLTLRDKLKEAKELALGIIDEHTDHARTELDAHIEQWGRVLAAKQTTRAQIDLAVGRLKRLGRLAGWERLHQITHDSAILALAKVHAPLEEGGLGKSLATRNHYLGHLRALVAWAHDGGRMKANPVRSIRPLNTETDRRHLRRVPTPEEVEELCRWLVLATTPDRRGLTGAERRLGYLVSMATGFRAGELRALTRSSFDLKAETVCVPAGYSKRRRTDTQPLPKWLVGELCEWFAGDGGWRWHELVKAAPGKMLQEDLADCRTAWIALGKGGRQRELRAESDFLRYRIDTAEGPKFWDYHSFRHCYNSFMANLPGMDLKTLLTVTRLSSAELALKTYAHTDAERVRQAADQVPPPDGRSK